MAFAFSFCCAACSMQSSPLATEVQQDQTSSWFLRPYKPPHTLEILTWAKDLDDLESARNLPWKEKLNEYWDKKHEKKKELLNFSNLRDEFQQFQYLLTGNEHARKLEKDWVVIATWTEIIAFEKNDKDFVLCRDNNGFIHCQNWEKALNIGYNSEVLPRFFNGALWSVQLIDEHEDTYGVFKDQELLYQFQATFITFDPILAFEVNENGWWLSYSKSFYGEERMQDLIIHNGENLNEKYWRDQAFALIKIKNQIFYFVQNKGEIAYRLNEQTFPLQWEEIASWKCCSAAFFYPNVYPDFVEFYFKKDGFWYNGLLWL